MLATSPTVVGDKVIVGNAGEDFGVRGWLAALDAATGRTVWKVFNTGPDSDVGIGRRFHPQHQQDYGSRSRRNELASIGVATGRWRARWTARLR